MLLPTLRLFHAAEIKLEILPSLHGNPLYTQEKLRKFNTVRGLWGIIMMTLSPLLLRGITSDDKVKPGLSEFYTVLVYGSVLSPNN